MLLPTVDFRSIEILTTNLDEEDGDVPDGTTAAEGETADRGIDRT